MSRRVRARASFLFSLRGRLLFLICLATLPAILFTFFVAENERTNSLARTERDALHLADLASREHAHQIRGARELLSWLGARVVREGRRSPIITDGDFLRALLAGHPQLANIGVLSPDGQVLTSAYPLASYLSWTDNPAYIAAMSSEHVATGTYVISPIFDRPTLNLAYAIRGTDKEVIAVLFNGLDLSWLSEMARESSQSDGFSLLITDQDGRVIANGGPAQPEMADTGDVVIPGVSRLALSRRGTMLEMPTEGVRRYFVATPLEEALGLFVAVGLPYDQVVRQANSAFYRALAGLGILTMFTIAAVFIAAELGVLRGVRSLAHIAQRFGAGEFSARARVARGHNEFAALATALNTMADSLAARHREAVEAQTQLKALASRLHVAREMEAARISRELHDEIGQVLTSLKIDLSRLVSKCPPSERSRPCSTALQEGIEAMNEQIVAAVDFVRRISSELRPGVLDKLGLTAALEWLAREVEGHSDLIVQVEADNADSTLDELTAVTLFRIAQEALTNVVRHAGAHIAEIHLVATAESITLEISDDGAGIPVHSAAGSESLGIVGMRERAMLINGTLSIRGVSGRGTTVCVTVPIQPVTEVPDAHSAR